MRSQGFQSGLLVILCLSVVYAQDDQSGGSSNKCDPGKVPTEIISAAGQLNLFCHDASACQALAQGTATCNEAWVAACAATSFVGAIRPGDVDEKGTVKYSVQCCQHPGITSANVIRVINKFLKPDDSFIEDVSKGALQLISNIFDLESGKHIIQMTKIKCA